MGRVLLLLLLALGPLRVSDRTASSCAASICAATLKGKEVTPTPVRGKDGSEKVRGAGIAKKGVPGVGPGGPTYREVPRRPHKHMEMRARLELHKEWPLEETAAMLAAKTEKEKEVMKMSLMKLRGKEEKW